MGGKDVFSLHLPYYDVVLYFLLNILRIIINVPFLNFKLINNFRNKKHNIEITTDT